MAIEDLILNGLLWVMVIVALYFGNKKKGDGEDG